MKIKMELSAEYVRAEEKTSGVVSKCEVIFATYEEALAFHQKMTNLVKEHSDARSTSA